VRRGRARALPARIRERGAVTLLGRSVARIRSQAARISITRRSSAHRADRSASLAKWARSERIPRRQQHLLAVGTVGPVDPQSTLANPASSWLMLPISGALKREVRWRCDVRAGIDEPQRAAQHPAAHVQLDPNGSVRARRRCPPSPRARWRTAGRASPGGSPCSRPRRSSRTPRPTSGCRSRGIGARLAHSAGPRLRRGAPLTSGTEPSDWDRRSGAPAVRRGAHDDDRAGGVRHHVLADRAEQQAREPTVAPAAHDEKTGIG
jgi:hypothetical protein